MNVSRLQRPWSRRVVTIVALGVAVPAALLVTLGIFLTLRIARAIENESVRYDTYIASQVGEAFEQELMEQLRSSIMVAENAARNGAAAPEILAALATSKGEFLAPHFVPTDELTNFSILMVDGQALLYEPDPAGRRYFAGVLLRDAQGQFSGAAGWWMEPRSYLVGHLASVVQERLPSNPRLYGGIVSTRMLAIQILDSQNAELVRVRDPESDPTARSLALSGPFERFTVRVSPTTNSAVTLATRFVAIEVTFIGLMGLAIVLATLFGMRYVLRQVELAQMKSGFVSNVTHELKTPIALIRLAVETLEMGRVNSPAESERFLRTIGRETQRLEQLVNNILDFARLEAGRHVFHFESVDLANVVHGALENFRPRLEHQGFAVELDVPEHLPPVRADATAITHCLLNLLDNALKYSKADRRVRVSAGVRGDAVAISVSDRGIGIAPEDRTRVFEKFTRLETGLVHDVKGAGLGLSLVDQIIRAHGGRVELESNVGEGSTFTLLLPLEHGAETAEVEPRRKTGT
jgi:signal transduction histidine kinase